MGSIEWNRRLWDDQKNWASFGDSWTFHAKASGLPYEEWKQSVVSNFIEPNLGAAVDLLEIAPGQGRWTEFIVGRVKTLTLVDVAPSCIEACRARFEAGHPEITFLVNDGRTLDVPDESVDVVWSFAGFVHIDEPDIAAYTSEVLRVLRPGGRFVIHHSGLRDSALRFSEAAQKLPRFGKAVFNRFAQGTWHGAGRSAMSAERFAALVTGQGLVVDEQLRSWGEEGRYKVAYGDAITVGSRPASDGRPTDGSPRAPHRHLARQTHSVQVEHR
jgi:ubiquinone/menaquinone biosynthesis C-methylase UbiE